MSCELERVYSEGLWDSSRSRELRARIYKLPSQEIVSTLIYPAVTFDENDAWLFHACISQPIPLEVVFEVWTRTRGSLPAPPDKNSGNYLLPIPGFTLDERVIVEPLCGLLAVENASFEADWTPRGVSIRWTTVTEIDTVGFRLLRERSDRREKVIDVIAPMIPSSGTSLRGASYRFLDNEKLRTDVVRYHIEDIDIPGKVTRHGPVEVRREVPGSRGDRSAK